MLNHQFLMKVPLDGDKLLGLRSVRKQKTVEDEIGLPRGRLSSFERGTVRATIKEVKALANFYRVQPEVLIGQNVKIEAANLYCLLYVHMEFEKQT